MEGMEGKEKRSHGRNERRGSPCIMRVTEKGTDGRRKENGRKAKGRKIKKWKRMENQ